MGPGGRCYYTAVRRNRSSTEQCNKRSADQSAYDSQGEIEGNILITPAEERADEISGYPSEYDPDEERCHLLRAGKQLKLPRNPLSPVRDKRFPCSPCAMAGATLISKFSFEEIAALISGY